MASSEIRVNTIKSRSGLSTITLSDTGNIISGITTIRGSFSVESPDAFNTNIYSVGVSTFSNLHVGLGGTIITSIPTGNVGISTTNPQYTLDVAGDINFTGTFRQNGSAFVASRWTAGTGDNIYRLDGNVGIGTTNPTSKLTVDGTVSLNGNVTLGDNTDDNISVNGEFITNLIPNVTNSYDLGSATQKWRDIWIAGTATAADFNSTSDVKWKQNITTIDDPLLKVMQIRGVTFDWKHVQQTSAGVIAQEVEKVLPEIIKGEDGSKTVNYNGLIGLLVECIKDQQKQIDEIKKMLENHK